MSAKQCINITFLGNENVGKTTIINGLIEQYSVGKHETLLEIKYGSNLEPILATDDNLTPIYYIDFEWGKDKLFDCSMINYGSNEKLAISDLHTIDYLVYVLDSTNLVSKESFFRDLFKAVNQNKYLTQISVVFNKYDRKFEKQINEYLEMIIQIQEEFKGKFSSFKIDARKMMVMQIAEKNKDVSSIPQDILFDFYNEYFGKILSQGLIIQTKYEHIHSMALNQLSFSDIEKSFMEYIKGIPDNNDYYREKCATLTGHILDYMKKNYEKEFDKYIHFIDFFIEENSDIFTNDNVMKIYLNAFSTYYEMNTTQFLAENYFVENVFLELVKIVKSKVFDTYVKKETIISDYFDKTLLKIIEFHQPKNINYISMIKYIDNTKYYEQFIAYYLRDCIEYGGFFKYKEINPDETSDDEAEDSENSDTENKNFMFVLNFIIGRSSYLDEKQIQLINIFLYKCVLSCLSYPTECLLKVMRPIYPYADRIYCSFVEEYMASEFDFLMRMKFNYMTKTLDLDYDFIKNNTIMKLIGRMDDMYSNKDKDFIYPPEVIRL